MQTYKLTPGSKIVIVLLIIGAVAALAYGLKSMHQTESDCSLSETYNSSAGKCVIKTGQQYANELSKIDAEKTAADTEIKRRNGTLCIPAADASKYIGVSGCVRMIVKHYYVESYGWVWLDAGDTKSDFSVAILDKNILTKSDAEYYLGKTISVRGTIELYQGAPEIKISNKNAIFDVVSLEDSMTNTQEIRNEIATNAQCNSLEDARKKCEWSKTNNIDLGYCSTYKMFQGQFGDSCKNYIPKESTFDRRANCFNEKIKTATNKFQKDAVYSQCQNP